MRDILASSRLSAGPITWACHVHCHPALRRQSSLKDYYYSMIVIMSASREAREKREIINERRGEKGIISRPRERRERHGGTRGGDVPRLEYYEGHDVRERRFVGRRMRKREIEAVHRL